MVAGQRAKHDGGAACPADSHGVRLHDRLALAGFRRSQGFAYRPACPGCTACVPVRIPVATFRLSRDRTGNISTPDI